ncbi:nucleoside-binding protein [Kandleria vitulina DSM 20405]|jgi:basic membrane protein A|uniref:Nucleoside-binding protein n=1 Tax=Kandleria vitulina DSM 20405 TaxID=1410657 RepID=A0A0R2HDM0_9FIRM|nr:BMP family ABC transporter substrate-binding protein [Kandleria vitulina]KRN51145.1 nucleoside-binding protein [Kandleria vitulina DSM 20405]
MKKLIASLMVLSMVLVGCSGSNKKTEIALITDSGGINDKSFNQSAWEAVKEYGEKNDKGYKYYKPASFDDEGYKKQIKSAVKNGAKIVVLPGFKFANAMGDIQEDKTYKDVKFVCIDFTPTKKDAAVDPAENVYCASYKEQQPGYLAGYAAVKDGYTKLGFMGGISLPAVINYGYGYLQGANDAAKELNKKITVNYTYTGTFNESPSIKTQATAWYNGGTEIIFSCGGQICNSVFAAAEDTKKFSIGVDSDQKDDSKTVVTSALKNVKQTVADQITAVYDNKFKGGAYVLDASGSYIGLSSDFSRFKTFKKADYEAEYAKIKDGTTKILTHSDDESAKGNPNKTVKLKAALTNVTVKFEG